MAVSIPLDFIPPGEPGIVALRIYESPTKTGSYTQIERVTAIGAYPNYITRYETALAGAVDHWFAIAWESTGGFVGELSVPVQGGKTTLVGILTDRMILRDPALNEIIAAEEAEGAISDYYGTIDPFSVDPATVSPYILSGLTMLALARAYIVTALTTSTTQSYTAGLVQQTSGSATKQQQNIEGFLNLANRMLGRNYSFVALMEELEVAGGFRQLVGVDVTRGIIEIA